MNPRASKMLLQKEWKRNQRSVVSFNPSSFRSKFFGDNYKGVLSHTSPPKWSWWRTFWVTEASLGFCGSMNIHTPCKFTKDAVCAPQFVGYNPRTFLSKYEALQSACKNFTGVVSCQTRWKPLWAYFCKVQQVKMVVPFGWGPYGLAERCLNGFTIQKNRCSGCLPSNSTNLTYSWFSAPTSFKYPLFGRKSTFFLKDTPLVAG